MEEIYSEGTHAVEQLYLDSLVYPLPVFRSLDDIVD